jgi:DNA-binding SARP family transcriptional activator/TolB-like protein/Tfp pilus assembly protein PilF
MGRFRLCRDDGTSVPLAGRRSRALLGYLCFAGPAGATREQLSGLMWSDRGEAQARASLRQCVLELRGVLKAHDLDILTVGRETIALSPDAATYDVGELLAALDGEDSEAATAATRAVGRGQLLEDAEVPGLFSEWREIQRSWLEDRIASGVHRHIEKLESKGDWPAVRALAEAYLHRDPTNEPVVAAAMRADAALGSTSAVHRRFKVLQAALERDYGVKPVGAARDALAAVSASAASKTAPPEPAAPSPPPRARTEGPPMLLVAAFDEEPSGPNHFAASMREEVVSGLSRFRDLRVITDPRPMSSLQEDAAHPNLNYILGARYRAASGGGRLTVQLARAEDRHVLWSEGLTVEQVQLDPMASLDGMIAKVIGAVLPTIEADLARNPRPASADIYQRYVLARDAALSVETHAEALAAAAALEALIETDPKFALPYLPLAKLYNTDFCYTLAGSSGPDQRARALALAKRALSIDRSHVHGYTVTGWCYLRQRRWEPAKAHFDQAIALNPFYAGRLVEVGFGHVFLGDLDRARALIDRCLLLNPAPDDEFFADLGLLELLRGEHDRAASYFDLVADSHIWAQIHGAINAAMAGACSPDTAAAALQRIAAIWPAGRPFTHDAVLEWIAAQHPFRDEEMERRFLAGVREMLSRSGAEPPPTLQ